MVGSNVHTYFLDPLFSIDATIQQQIITNFCNLRSHFACCTFDRRLALKRNMSRAEPQIFQHFSEYTFFNLRLHNGNFFRLVYVCFFSCETQC
jgi:hypothetical protein